MNHNQKQIKEFLEKAERMYGFDSYDSFDDFDGDDFDGDDFDGDDFDGDDISYFDNDEMSYASGGVRVPVSNPYVVEYQNTNAVTVTGVLFGYNDNFLATNFGNPAGVIVTNLQGGTYGRLIAQTNNKFFRIQRWRFQSATAGQLQQTLNITHVDANGKQYSVPMNLSIMRDAYQQQSDILDVVKPVTVDGNTVITFNLLPNTTFVISMFPTTIISGKARLNGSTSIIKTKAPRLSGKNVSPVVIQTNQGIQKVEKK
ncbi:MAG: hypothetical protein QXM96_00295 [Candidatus Woesearchaeota archaeon]